MSHQDELVRLEAFIGWWGSNIWGIPESAWEHPSHALCEMEKSGLSATRKLSGIEQALNDIVESSIDIGYDESLRIDSLLSGVGILTLTDARLRSSRYLKQLLKKGRIVTDTDYHLVISALEDSARFNEATQSQLRRMLDDHTASS